MFSQRGDRTLGWKLSILGDVGLRYALSVPQHLGMVGALLKVEISFSFLLIPRTSGRLTKASFSLSV